MLINTQKKLPEQHGRRNYDTASKSLGPSETFIKTCYCSHLYAVERRQSSMNSGQVRDSFVFVIIRTLLYQALVYRQWFLIAA